MQLYYCSIWVDSGGVGEEAIRSGGFISLAYSYFVLTLSIDSGDGLHEGKYQTLKTMQVILTLGLRGPWVSPSLGHPSPPLVSGYPKQHSSLSLVLISGIHLLCLVLILLLVIVDTFSCIECHGIVGEVTNCGEVIEIGSLHTMVNCSGFCMVSEHLNSLKMYHNPFILT